MINFISNYWECIVVGIIVAIGLIGAIYNFSKKSKAEKISKVKEWLLYAVLEAEKEFGSHTGEIKLRFVYDLFVTKFPTVAKVISFETFCGYVDDTLKKLEELLENNNELKSYVEGDE